jgi:O-antigen ligase
MRSIRSQVPGGSIGSFALPLFAGAAIAIVMSLVLYGLNKPVLIYLFVAGLVVLIPSAFVKDVPLYWMCIFLFTLQFELKKNLVDGLAVLDALKIDYMQFVFTPEVRLSDLPLLVMLFLWVHKMGSQGKQLIVPKGSWFALVFLGCAAISAIKAPHFYLSAIEIVRQCKFFIIYLYAASNIGSKKTVKFIFIMLAIALVLQGAVTLGRYQFKYFEPLESLLGVENRMDPQKRDDALAIDTQGETGFGFTEARRSFGTLPSPAATTKFCLMAFPIVLMLSLANPLMMHRWIFLLIVPFALFAFYFSFSRTSMVACLAQIALFYWYGMRRGYMTKHIAIYLLGGVLLAGVFSFPKLYDFMTSRYDAVEVRLRQYEVTTNMILSNPVFGVGINNSTGVKKDLTEDSAYIADPLRRSGEQPIHSFYLTLMAETGLVGFLCYMGFFAFTYRDALALSRSARDREIAFAATILLICFAGIAIGVLTDPLYEDAVQTLLWLYAGIVVALKRLDQDEVSAAT